MKDHTRRVIAYIVGRLVLESNATLLYDYQALRHYSFNGEITPEHVAVYDADHGYHIEGTGNRGSYTMFHYGNNRQLDLDVKEKEFQGYDHDVGKHFSGSVTGTAISIYDYEFSRYFHFSM